jgi:MFS family permease
VSGAYLYGRAVGALFFGWLTDRLGRKRLFFITSRALSGRHRGTALWICGALRYFDS